MGFASPVSPAHSPLLPDSYMRTDLLPGIYRHVHRPGDENAAGSPIHHLADGIAHVVAACDGIDLFGCVGPDTLPALRSSGDVAVRSHAALRRFVSVGGHNRRKSARVFGLSRDIMRKLRRYPAPPGYRRTRPRQAIADAACDADPLRALIADDLGATAWIKANPRRTGKPPIDWRLHKERHQIECFLNKLERFRRIARRCENTVPAFMGFVHLACAMIRLRWMQTRPSSCARYIRRATGPGPRR